MEGKGNGEEIFRKVVEMTVNCILKHGKKRAAFRENRACKADRRTTAAGAESSRLESPADQECVGASVGSRFASMSSAATPPSPAARTGSPAGLARPAPETSSRRYPQCALPERALRGRAPPNGFWELKTKRCESAWTYQTQRDSTVGALQSHVAKAWPLHE
eukprot:1291712-Pleurochrysis_carterae.AAC.4